MQSKSERADVLGTFMRTVRGPSSLVAMLDTIARRGPEIRLSDLAEGLGLQDGDFATLVSEVEQEGFVRRSKAEGRTTVSLTPDGFRYLHGATSGR